LLVSDLEKHTLLNSSTHIEIELKGHRLDFHLNKWQPLRRVLTELEVESQKSIPPVLLVILVQNGMLERLLQVILKNEIEVDIRLQKKSGSLLFREVQIRSRLDGALVVYARSKIETKYLPDALLDRLIEGKEGVGSIIEDLRIETFRRIKVIGYSRKERALYRIYDIYIHRRLAITITEYFPIDHALWRS
jgi:chorismate-pyruvate lyase